MRRARARGARLAVVGLGLSWFFVGCGGSGVPDPASDSTAAGDSPPVAEAPEAVPSARPEVKKAEGEMLASNEAKPAESSSDPAPRPPTRRGQDPAAETPAATTEPAPAAAPKGDATGTNELLNLANNSAAAPSDAAAPKDEGSSSGSPGAPPGTFGPVPGGPGAPPGSYGPVPGGPPNMNAPGPPGGQPGPASPDSMRPPAGMNIPGGSGSGSGLGDSGMSGMPGGSGGGADDLKGRPTSRPLWRASAPS